MQPGITSENREFARDARELGRKAFATRAGVGILSGGFVGSAWRRDVAFRAPHRGEFVQ